MATHNVSSTETTGNTEFADINALHLAPLSVLDLRDLRARKTQQLEMLRAVRINAEDDLLDAAHGDVELMDELIMDVEEQCSAVLAELMARLTARKDEYNTAA
ncbi:MAG: hypothetical protein EKK45_27885 [Curvibacter sp.]|nr:MAG: hypothetical protein EKK45_27885 [Curvibacter sp.]